VVKEGEKLKVKVLEIGRDGKIRLSHKALLEEGDGRTHR
jgi:polyribonucleotide nucleotidyltransferase